MSAISITPDLSSLEIPKDAWTQPFWDATARRQLLAPRCGACARFRWPPGPFCPHCRSQNVEWIAPGEARIYSFTIVAERRAENEAPAWRVPALIEFPAADGIRMMGAIVDTRISMIRIGSPVEIRWAEAANGTVPMFAIS